MMRRLGVFASVLAIGLAAGARGQGIIDERLRDRLDNAPVTVDVACGALNQAPCAKILPRIAARMAQAGIVLNAVGSGGTLDAVAAVCEGRAGAAIVQRDALTACMGGYDVAGSPLYPYYALLVAKADAAFRDMADGRRRTIAAGPAGSGGQVTLGILLRSNPDLRVEVTDDGIETALARIADGSADGFFAVETLDSDLIDRVRLKTDARGAPLYKFVDVHPASAFFRAGDEAGHCLYRLAALDFGGSVPVTTVSVDAVMVLGRAFRDVHARGGPRVSDSLLSAIDSSRAAILSGMKSPTGWRPASLPCH
jgi:hypothetical protein